MKNKREPTQSVSVPLKGFVPRRTKHFENAFSEAALLPLGESAAAPGAMLVNSLGGAVNAHRCC
jgi:hypothetical protein